MTSASVLERRNGPDRRVRRSSLHYPERRTGFDRRALGASTHLRLLDAYRRSPALIAWCVAGIVALSAADLLLTWRLIALGASEINPVMARLYDSGLVSAAALKGAVTLALVGGIWLMRRYRRVLEFSVAALVLLAALVAYEAVGLLISSR